VTHAWNTRPVVFTTLARFSRAFNFIHHSMDKCVQLRVLWKEKGRRREDRKGCYGWDPALKQVLLCFDHLSGKMYSWKLTNRFSLWRS
jgi:hypothetical protein